MQKTALITGASSGLGAETANFLHSKGFRVLGTSRNPENQSNKNIHWLKLDLCDKNSIQDFSTKLLAQDSLPQIIIHNAGIGTLGAALDLGANDFRKVFESNFFGVCELNRLLSDHIIKNKIKLIFISSLAGAYGLNYRSAYVASKHALEGYVKSLRMELLEFGVQVCIIAPGDVKTSIADARIEVVPTEHRPWNNRYKQVVDKINSEVESGIHPKDAAKIIYQICLKERFKYRYIIAPGIQKLSFLLHKLLPYSLFEKLLINHYNK